MSKPKAIVQGESDLDALERAARKALDSEPIHDGTDLADMIRTKNRLRRIQNEIAIAVQTIEDAIEERTNTA